MVISPGLGLVIRRMAEVVVVQADIIMVGIMVIVAGMAEEDMVEVMEEDMVEVMAEDMGEDTAEVTLEDTAARLMARHMILAMPRNTAAVITSLRGW